MGARDHSRRLGTALGSGTISELSRDLQAWREIDSRSLPVSGVPASRMRPACAPSVGQNTRAGHRPSSVGTSPQKPCGPASNPSVAFTAVLSTSFCSVCTSSAPRLSTCVPMSSACHPFPGGSSRTQSVLRPVVAPDRRLAQCDRQRRGADVRSVNASGPVPSIGPPQRQNRIRAPVVRLQLVAEDGVVGSEPARGSMCAVTPRWLGKDVRERDQNEQYCENRRQGENPPRGLPRGRRQFRGRCRRRD